MNNPPPLSRADFEEILSEHRRLVELASELEFHVYQLGEAPQESPITACQQAAGGLIGSLRQYLFRQDQQVLPVLESLITPTKEER